MKPYLILCIFSIALSACDKPASSTKAVEAPAPVKTIIDDQLKALQKAKDMAKQVEDAAEKQRQTIDALTK